MTRDLTNTSVFFDFDGTITMHDTGVHLLETFAEPAAWADLDEQYKAGTLGSRDVIDLQWQTMHATEAEYRAAAMQVEIDPGFLPLLDGLKAANAEIAVVSDGWGFYIPDMVGDLGIPVMTNTIDFVTNTLISPFRDESCATCGLCGTCKPKIVQEAANRGRLTVFIGDGTSDRHAARVANEVFAKGALARWCADEGIPHTAFGVLDEVATALLP